MLSAIVAVTLVVPDVEAVERAYRRELGYETVERGRLAEGTTATWGAAGLTGRSYIVMKPASGEPVYLRVVKAEAAPRPALKTLGWNATEILVEDPYELSRRFERSPFRVIGPPAPLDVNPAVVAMQALGPAGELFYFTRIPPGKSKFNLGSATSFVDRVFIVVLGVHDIRKTLDFYAGTFGLSVTDPGLSHIGVLAQAWGLSPEQTFPLAIVRLPERFLVEVDEYPAEASSPPVATGEMPAGMALVSFAIPSLEPLKDRLVAAPRVLQGLPYSGRRVGVMRGPSGELMELIESPPGDSSQR
ncbi:MAG: hypothetical protein FIB04_00165 [Gammaproteobacteria bacterium]|nr:hypothetical protein [Gammaproteobacteria bacterium]